jgi:hypothetical protein
MARTRFGRALVMAVPMVIACGAAVGVVSAQSKQDAGLPQSGQTSATQNGPASSRVARYAKALGLDANQTEAARDLYEAYQKDTAAAGKKMQRVLGDAQADMNDGDRAAFEKGVQKSMGEHAAASKQLTEKFLADLKSILRADQVDRWPVLERLRRREQYLSSMMTIGGMGVSGSSVDLIPIVRGLTDKASLPAKTQGKIDEALGLYEMDVDRPLKERQQHMEDEQRAMGAVQHFEQGEFEKKLERDRKVDLAIREVNGKYLKTIEELLPEELAKTLAENYQVRAFRSIYKASSVAKKMAGAMKVEGLSADQRSRLQAAMDSYKREARAANDRWAAAQYRAETEGKATGGGLMFIGAGGPGGSGGSGEKVDPELADARAARRAVDDKARSQLEGILTAEQMAAIPKPEVNGMMAHTVSVIGDGVGEDAVFVADMDMDGVTPPEGGGGGPVMIIRTVETHGGGGAPEKKSEK